MGIFRRLTEVISGFMSERHRPLFGMLSVSSIISLTLLYVIAAEFTKFNLVGARLPSYHWIPHRASEAMLVWSLGCLVYGWLLALTGRLGRRTLNVGPVAAVPLCIGFVVGLYNLRAFDVWPFPQYTGPNSERLKWIILRITAAVWISVVGLALGYMLKAHGRIWRYFSVDGQCRYCEYDLTGNRSGVCPECGKPIARSESEKKKC